jgi:dihydropteroate synthase
MPAAVAARRIGSRLFAFGSRTFVMGIVNVTPDSFSGDGLRDPASAVARAVAMEDDGADLIDVGGESTRPATWGKPPLEAEEELRRVIPVVEQLAGRLSVPISIDTSKARVAEAALDAGASLINDVSGLSRDPQMAPLCARRGTPVVIMHQGAVEGNLMDGIVQGLRGRLRDAREAGIGEDQIIVDPGIGFGKMGRENLEIIRRLGDLRGLSHPILVGPSRKAFIGLPLGLPVTDRLEGTAAAVALSVANGADLVRVHDVHAMVRVVRMADAIVRPAPPSPAAVTLALGSNLGDRSNNLARARRALGERGVSVLRASTVRETAPVGVIDQPPFLNQVLEVRTTFAPLALLQLVKQVEVDLGRTPGPRWGPRVIDIDILRYGNEVIDAPELRIPHPELENRPFLLELLAEIGQ